MSGMLCPIVKARTGDNVASRERVENYNRCAQSFRPLPKIWILCLEISSLMDLPPAPGLLSQVIRYVVADVVMERYVGGTSWIMGRHLEVQQCHLNSVGGSN